MRDWRSAIISLIAIPLSLLAAIAVLVAAVSSAQFVQYTAPGSLAVEQLMKHYYRTVKELALLNEILLQHFQEAILSQREKRVRRINRRFQSRDTFLEVTRKNVFDRSPFAMLELFLVRLPQLRGGRGQALDHAVHLDQALQDLALAERLGARLALRNRLSVDAAVERLGFFQGLDPQLLV